MKISHYATDKTLETEGAWVDMGKGFAVLVARTTNSRYRSLVRERLKPHQRKIQNGTMDDELRDDIVLKCICEAVVLGWKGLEDEKGKEIKYSPAVAHKLFTDYPDLREDVLLVANTMETFRKGEEKDNEGNS